MMTPDEHRRALYGLCIAPSTFRFRKITDSADARMRTRTAKEQHAEALAALKGPDDLPLPDADNDAMQRAGVLT